jgi:hypothetical protein
VQPGEVTVEDYHVVGYGRLPVAVSGSYIHDSALIGPRVSFRR